MDRERLPEQEAVLDEMVEICERENVSVVLVAGDVFDTFMPSAEAEEVFYRAVKKLAGDTRAVVIVSGNHDDGVRLAAAAPLGAEQGIYVFGNRPHVFPCGGSRPVRAVEAGEYYLVLQNAAGERVYINCLPYPNEARFKEEKTDESFAQKMARWIGRGDSAYRADMPHILLTHLFVAGGKTSESEREIDLGGARAVPLNLLPEKGYTALGHLHRRQKLAGNAVYSGSLLQYSFDEANTPKGVTLVTTGGGLDVAYRDIDFRSGKKLVRLECADFDSALSLLPQYENCFIELTLHLDQPLTATETQALRAANGGLVSLITAVKGEAYTPAIARASLSPRDLFTEYYRGQYGEEPSEQLMSAFLSLLEEP